MRLHIFPTPSTLTLSRIVRRIAIITLSMLTLPPVHPVPSVSLHRLVMLLLLFLTGFLMPGAALLSGVSMVLPSLNTRLPVIVTTFRGILTVIITVIRSGLAVIVTFVRGCLPVIIATLRGGLPVIFHESIPQLVAILRSLDYAVPDIFSTFGFQAIVQLTLRFRRPVALTCSNMTTAL